MKGLMTKCAATLPLFLCLTGLAAADPAKKCRENILQGKYVFSATGFTRKTGSAPGTPWAPKAIVEVIHFDGRGRLSTPALTLANPFGDFGNVVQPPGADGTYTINHDCTGTVNFDDTSKVAFSIYVAPPRGETIWMIQTNPDNNVFQGKAERVW